MTKSEIRSSYLVKRDSLSESDYLLSCQKIAQQFFLSFDLSFVKVIHTFLPMVHKHEPDTWLIIERLRREFPHIRLSIPKINLKSDSLENFYFEGLHQLAENNWGIKQPKQGVPTDSEKVDMVLVPLLAFDDHGHRVGYGKGYYDKFLSTCRPDCIKIGLSLFPASERIPSEPQDIALNWCITPDAVLKFG
ncbi:MAG: 5-formyltetrahydrofolate cyclo-ligase [Cyclobacteriaceae bacterium]|nr:5-formyltetrahydrofolate cyclo-ligase [Cyclobacteriaceae bacterium]